MISLLNLLVLAFFVLLNAGYVALLLSAALALVRRRSAAAEGLSESRLLQGRATPAISVVAPAFNEEATIVESVRALLNLRYPEHEVIVVNDGSHDATVQRLREAFELQAVPVDLRPELPHRPLRAVYRARSDGRLLVLDKENGGKADALNAGITAARFGLVCAIDADTLVTPDALLHMVQPFREDPGALAVGGTLRVANGCTIDRGHVRTAGLPPSLVARFQVVEYLRAFLLGRMGWNRLGGNLIISGAFGLFRRNAVVAAGGYVVDTVGEDIELVVRLHRLSHSAKAGGGGVYHLADPVAFTEVPESLAVLGRQRDRWQRGLADTLWRHRDMLLRPRYGALGLFVLPFFLLFELFGPLVELFGYAYFVVALVGGFIEPVFALLFLTVALLLGFLLSVGSLLLEELSFSLYRRRGDLARLVLIALLENFGYRQLTLWWRLRGLWGYLRGQKGWGRMVRTGFSGPRPPGAPAAPRPRREARGAAPWVVGALALLLLALPLGWLLTPAAPTRVAVLDRTVPTDFREHAWLMWGLSQARAPAPGGRRLWRPEDALGTTPGSTLDAAALARVDLLYLADPHGAFAAGPAAGAPERGARGVGGLGAPELDAIEAFARRGGRVVAEFNTFASPTSPTVRARLERLLGVRWTGWVGRRFPALERVEEVPAWVRAGVPGTWTHAGPGLVFAHDDGRVRVLPEAGEAPVRLEAAGGEAPYDAWFDVVQVAPGAPREVRARYRLHVGEASARQLAQDGIPLELPALVAARDGRTAYLAGDFADGAASIGPPWLWGVPWLRGAMARVGLTPREARVLWMFYLPFLRDTVRRPPGHLLSAEGGGEG